MKSTWIVIGRDAHFGSQHATEHLYVFESSFDAYAFVQLANQYDHLPEIARTIRWEVTEHPINTTKGKAVATFINTFANDMQVAEDDDEDSGLVAVDPKRLAEVIEQAKEKKDEQ